jgi:starch-binding outer membrane protein, SusD/RagB family
MKRIATLLFLVVSFSCQDLDEPITRDFTEASYWRNEQDALDALTACYENMFATDYFFSNEALSDNAYNKSTSYDGVGQIASGSYDNRTPRIVSEWSYHYAGIRKCNVVLENVDKIDGSTPEKIARFKAEARFIRAYAFFQLTSFYGAVPLVTNVLTLSEAKSIRRTPQPEIIDFVLQELETIQQDLPVVYTVASDNGRITRATAIALRARVNLYNGNWAGVASDCEKLIGTSANGVFSLHNNYQELFTAVSENSNEIILALQFGGARLQANQRFFLPQTVGKLRSNLVPTKSLVDNYVMTNGKAIGEAGSGFDENNPFANRDPRLDNTILHHGSTIVDFDGVTQTILTAPGSDPLTNTIEDQGASATGYYFQKYYDQTAVNFNSAVNLILIRYADVLLMYAEAKNELNSFNATIWNQTIRPIRQRAGFTQASAIDFDATASQSTLREIIQRERRTELAFEGLRIFDIQRWGISDEVLSQPVKGIRVSSNQFNQDENGYLIVEDRKFESPKHLLWPVPQFEIDQNQNLLPNNQGW